MNGSKKEPRCQPGRGAEAGGPTLRPHHTTGDACRQLAFYAQSDEMPGDGKFTTLREEAERAAWAAQLD